MAGVASRPALNGAVAVVEEWLSNAETSRDDGGRWRVRVLAASEAAADGAAAPTVALRPQNLRPLDARFGISVRAREAAGLRAPPGTAECEVCVDVT